MARPSFEVTENDRKVVRRMAAIGCHHGAIAELLGIGLKTMRKYFGAELGQAALEANAKAMSPAVMTSSSQLRSLEVPSLDVLHYQDGSAIYDY